MQEGGRKDESTGSRRFLNTLWTKIGSGRTSFYTDGLIDWVFVEILTVSQFYDSDTQIQTSY